MQGYLIIYYVHDDGTLPLKGENVNGYRVDSHPRIYLDIKKAQARVEALEKQHPGIITNILILPVH